MPPCSALLADSEQPAHAHLFELGALDDCALELVGGGEFAGLGGERRGVDHVAGALRQGTRIIHRVGQLARQLQVRHDPRDMRRFAGPNKHAHLGRGVLDSRLAHFLEPVTRQGHPQRPLRFGLLDAAREQPVDPQRGGRESLLDQPGRGTAGGLADLAGREAVLGSEAHSQDTATLARACRVRQTAHLVWQTAHADQFAERVVALGVDVRQQRHRRLRLGDQRDDEHAAKPRRLGAGGKLEFGSVPGHRHPSGVGIRGSFGSCWVSVACNEDGEKGSGTEAPAGARGPGATRDSPHARRRLRTPTTYPSVTAALRVGPRCASLRPPPAPRGFGSPM